MNNISYAPDESEETRLAMEDFVRTLHPDLTDETTIKAVAAKMVIQFPLYQVIGALEKELKETKAALAGAQYRNTKQDASTAGGVKTLKADLAKVEKKLTAAEEDAERYKKQRDGYEAQVIGLLKGQRT